MFVLVRHSHAGEKKQWHGPDVERPLSPLGHEQAHGLVAALSGIEIETLLSSPTTRCRQTLLPLAQARGLPIHDEPLLAPDAPPTNCSPRYTDPTPTGRFSAPTGRSSTRWPSSRSRAEYRASSSGATAKGGVWFVDCGAGPPPALRYLAPIPTG